MTTRWKPSATVAAIIEKNGKFLLVEEHTSEGLRLNNPAGHLDEGETLIEACAREAMEETTHPFKPTRLIGVYMSRFQRPAHKDTPSQDVTYLRFAFCGELGDAQAERSLDTGIVRTLWMTPEEIRASAERHRSPLIIQCMEDYLSGQRFPLDLIYTDPTVVGINDC
jgi:8-oxo-dGTP pyrophosphatase MutT (NUDIX family)